MKLEKIIVILGPPGSGKGTQSKLLMEKLNYAFFSMGDTLREYAKKESALGKQIKVSIDQGLIVPDDLSEQVVFSAWNEMTDKPGMISEGFPRTPGQVEMINRFVDQQQIKDIRVLSIQVDKQKLIDRLVRRSKIEGRIDDADIASIEKRFDEYNDKTAKIIEFYRSQNTVIEINGDQPIEQVHKEIIQKLGL